MRLPPQKCWARAEPPSLASPTVARNLYLLFDTGSPPTTSGCGSCPAGRRPAMPRAGPAGHQRSAPACISDVAPCPVRASRAFLARKPPPPGCPGALGLAKVGPRPVPLRGQQVADRARRTVAYSGSRLKRRGPSPVRPLREFGTRPAFEVSPTMVRTPPYRRPPAGAGEGGAAHGSWTQEEMRVAAIGPSGQIGTGGRDQGERPVVAQAVRGRRHAGEEVSASGQATLPTGCASASTVTTSAWTGYEVAPGQA